jgi:hypothetical protein
MTREQAIAIVVGIAATWGENAEEAFGRVLAGDSDEQCAAIAQSSGAELDEVKTVRDLWRAIELLNAKEQTP